MLYRYLRPYIPSPPPFSGSGSFVVPNGVTLLTFPWIIAGGASGGVGFQNTSNNHAGGGGGGAGGYTTTFTLPVTAGDVIDITIGAAGTTTNTGAGGPTFVTQNGTEVVRCVGGTRGGDISGFSNNVGGIGGIGGSPNGVGGAAGQTGGFGNGGAGAAGPMSGSTAGAGGTTLGGVSGTGFGSSGGGGGGNGGTNAQRFGGNGVGGYVQVLFS